MQKTFSHGAKIGVADTPSPGLNTQLSNEVFESDAKSYAPVDVEKMLRMGFVRKVYGILSVQLLCTFGIVFIFQTPSIRSQMLQCGQGGELHFDTTPLPGKPCHFARSTDVLSPTFQSQNDKPEWARAGQSSTGAAWMWGGYGAAFAALLMLVCCQSNARVFPRNYLILSLFTVCESFFIASYCTLMQTDTIMLAMGMTAAITVGLSLFACQTKIDFTGIGGYLFAGLWALIVFGWIGGLFWDTMPGMQPLYCFAGIFIFSLYIVYDTQLMMGGDHKLAIGLDDYVFAALNIYLDIINLFLLILELLNGNRD